MAANGERNWRSSKHRDEVRRALGPSVSPIDDAPTIAQERRRLSLTCPLPECHRSHQDRRDFFRHLKGPTEKPGPGKILGHGLSHAEAEQIANELLARYVR